jgi:transposase InsO family protein
MPWQETNVDEQRMQFVTVARQPGMTVTAACEQFGISRPTGYRWLRKWAGTETFAALREDSRRPRRSPRRTPAAATACVVALRQEYGWAGRKLRPLLREAGVTLSTATIDRIIRREGLVDPATSHRPATTRFERAAPNELWQMDFKGQYPLRDRTWCFPLSVLDDHSRFAVGLFALRGTEGAPVAAVLRQCFERYGLPVAMLVDHGCPWWSTSNGHGLTTLTVGLIEQGITLAYSGVRHPQTQGKVERFHRTLGERLRRWGVPQDFAAFPAALDRFRTEYNEVRPHEATQLRPPVTRYTPSPRAYQAVPPRWDYPRELDVRRVDHAGCLSIDGRRYFVCEALAARWVACHALGPRRLVQYRHLYVRDINLTTGRTTPMLARQHPQATADR